MNDVTQAFLEATFAPYRHLAGAADFRLEVRCLAAGERDGRRETAPRGWFPLSAKGLGRAAQAAKACRERWNVYYGVLPRREESGTAASTAAIGWLWCDIDGAAEPELATQLIDRAGLPAPHLLVGSGNGHHAYWRLAAPLLLTDAEGRQQVRSTLRRLCAAIGGEPDAPHADFASTDVARILRVPGTLNLKCPEHPLAVTLSAWNPDVDAITWSDWRRRLPAEPTPPQPQHPQKERKERKLWTPRLLRETSPIGTRHTNCKKMLTRMRHFGADPCALEEAGRAFCALNGFPVEDMLSTLEWVVKRM